jgi:uracil-DNA glycosylase family 4
MPYSPLDGFLPRNALVMGRRRPLNASPTGAVPIPAESSSTPVAARTEATEPSQAVPDTLSRLQAEMQGCTRCRLCEKRKNIVFGEGNPQAKLVFVGEGPGATEDDWGRPFVGAAGQLLDKMIGALGLKRDQVYIMNMVKCRPPGNRVPEPDEMDACRPYFDRQLALLQPQVIVALGKTAAQGMLQREIKITSERGQFVEFRGHKVMLTLHPAYLLRNPEAKRDAWEDLKKVAAAAGIQIPVRGPTGNA